MKYFVTEIVTVDGAEAKAITTKTDPKDAKMLFHQILASAYAQSKLDYCMASVTNEFGGVENIEVYHKPEPEPNED